MALSGVRAGGRGVSWRAAWQRLGRTRLFSAAWPHFAHQSRVLTSRSVLAVALIVASVPSKSGSQDFTKVVSEIDRVALFGRLGGFTPNPTRFGANNERSWNQFGHAGVGIELGYQVADRGNWLYEVDLGYTQMGGFRLRRDDAELHATVRELPTLSFYGVRKARRVHPYYGVAVGFARLQNASIYATDGTQYSLAAEAFTFGGSAGLSFGSPVAAPFIEAGYRYRDFPSIEYKTSSTLAVPSTWPRSLSFSGWHVDFGMQIGLKVLKGG